MIKQLTEDQATHYHEFQEFTHEYVTHSASDWDIKQSIPFDIVKKCAESGYLGGTLPKSMGGCGWDFVTFGLLNEAIARGSLSLSGLFNVHTMVAQSILKWGNDKQKEKWLPPMARGEITGALALTEPNAGSDLAGIASSFTENDTHLVINGEKKWITFGALADIILVFGQLNGKPTACIVEKSTPGFQVSPIKNMLGFRSAHLAILEFNQCEVSKDNIIGKPGFGLTYVAPYALIFGRIAVGWEATGLLRACYEECGYHVLNRKSFDRYLIDHGMIQSLITDMGIDLNAAYLLCLQASKAKDAKMPEAMQTILMSKYFASKAVSKHAANAVQIMGAMGCNEEHPVARYYREAKALEIIEGSSQIIQRLLGKTLAKKARKMKNNFERRG